MMTHGAVDEQDVRRIETHDEIATKAGFTFDEETLYTWGTKMTIGDAVVAERRQAWDQLPVVGALLGVVAEVAAKEQRRDFEIPISAIRMDATTGRIVTKGGSAGAPISPYALSQLLGRAGAPGAAGTYLATVPPALRGPHFDHWTARAYSNRKGVRVETATKLRTRIGSRGERAIFAAVSPRYTTYDLADAATDIVAAVDPSGRCKVISDGQRWEVTITFPNAHHALRVGDMQDAMVRVWSADDGTAGFRAQAGLNRIRCLNASLIPSVQGFDSVSHARKDMATKVKATIAAAYGKVEEFAGLWAKAAQEDIIGGIHTGVEVRVIFKTLVDKGLVHATHCNGGELVDRLVRAWEAERGYTRADIVNAITRAAHTESWQSVWTTRDLEEQAGQLLYQHVQLNPQGTGVSRLLEID